MHRRKLGFCFVVEKLYFKQIVWATAEMGKNVVFVIENLEMIFVVKTVLC